MADIQNSSQLLNYRGDAGLGFGTSGTPATGAEIGVLDIGNGAGFNQLANLTFQKNKELYDTRKKEADDMYNSFKELDLSTDKVLDVDRQVLLQDVKKVTDYLTAHPHAANPKTPDQIKENLELQSLKDNFKSNKAKAQVRYALKPEVDKSIAANTFDREDEKNWYDNYFNKPLEYVTPYQKHYTFDWNKLAGEQEKVSLDSYKGEFKNTDKYSSNLNTTVNNVLNKLNEGDKSFDGYINDQHSSYMDLYNASNAHKAELVADNRPDDAAKIVPPLFREINYANNYIKQYNTVHPDTPIPAFDPTKPLDKTQYALLQGISANARQSELIKESDLSDVYKFNTEEHRRNLELAKRKSGLKNEVYGILSQVVNPFNYESAEQIYKKAKGGVKGYSIENKSEDAKTGGIFYNDPSKTDKNYKGDQLYGNVAYGNGRAIAQVDGKLLEYKNGEWQKANDNIPIDDKILKAVGGSVDNVSVEGDKIKVTYTTFEGDKRTKTSKTVYYDPITYLKNIADNKDQFNATVKELQDKKININTKEGLRKAIELINGTSSADNTDEPKTLNASKWRKK